jgi:hypothetical protein
MTSPQQEQTEETEDGVPALFFQFNRFKNQSKRIVKDLLENPSIWHPPLPSVKFSSSSTKKLFLGVLGTLAFQNLLLLFNPRSTIHSIRQETGRVLRKL